MWLESILLQSQWERILSPSYDDLVIWIAKCAEGKASIWENNNYDYDYTGL